MDEPVVESAPKDQIRGTAFAILSEAFGLAYLIWTLTTSTPFDGSSMAAVTTNLVQLGLIIAIVVGFFDNRKSLLFGAALVSMSYNGISYLVDDSDVLYPFDTLFTSRATSVALAQLFYAIADLLWVIALLFIVIGLFGKRNQHKLMVFAEWLFLVASVLLMTAMICYAVSTKTDPSYAPEILGSFGDCFALLAYVEVLRLVFLAPGKGPVDVLPDNSEEPKA